MTEPTPDVIPAGDEPADELTVHVGGGDGQPERLLRLSRPDNGLVRVTEWNGTDWSSAVERVMAAEVLLRALEEAAQQRRRLSQELYAVRRWLTPQAG